MTARSKLALCVMAAVALVALGVSTAQETSEEAGVTSLVDEGWPRVREGDHFSLTIYQPQIHSWEKFRKLDVSMALVLSAEALEEPVVGALRLRGDTDVDSESRTVYIHGVEIVDVRFPALEGVTQERMREELHKLFPPEPVALSLDRITAAMDHSELSVREVKVKDDPPKIFYSTAAARLVIFDGEPVWVPIDMEKSKGFFAANTNWDVFRHGKEGAKKQAFYLRDGSYWYTATTIEGPWTATLDLPKPIRKLPATGDFREVLATIPPRTLAAAPPRFFVTLEPAELIAVDGDPALEPINDTDLLFVSNTESDLFFVIGEQQYYYLVSGRWFRAAGPEGPWQSAMDSIPSALAEIPEGHPKGHVLASVPGTRMAEEAVLEAQIPTLATVDRAAAAKGVEVSYVGDPEFRNIEGTGLAYAVNTASDVIRQGDVYYLCNQGVWFTGSAPAGPWQVATAVPDEIYDIPADSPVHHTSYVYVYDQTPDTVTYGYTPGYMGMYVTAGVVVFGTGWYYPPYYNPYYYPYPIYYPYPYSYGAGSWYNPNTGFYGRGYAAYGPYGGVGVGAAYNPRTGTYARGGYAYGYGGASKWGTAYNPRTGVSAGGYRSADPYSSWGEGVVKRGDQWAKGGYYSDERGTVRGVRTSEGTGAIGVRRGDSRAGIVKGEDNLYVGRDGEVYRRGEEGGWSKYGDGGWEGVEGDGSQRDAARDRAGDAAQDRGGNVSDQQRQAASDRASTTQGTQRRSSDVVSDLNRSASSRDRGSSRATSSSSWRSSGGYSGSYGRSSGGYGGGRSRGGGGFRRR